MLIAENPNEECLGAAYILWKNNPSHGRLFSIAIGPNHQSKGIGSVLLKECELEAASRNIEFIKLEVRPDNLSAISFYQRNGYQICGVLENFYEDGMMAVQMEKPQKIDIHESLI